jgi:pyruvyl transferase EpsO
MSDLRATMLDLRNKVSEIAKLIPRRSPVVFLDYPVYLNVGDLLIEKGTEAFLRSADYNVVAARSAYDFSPEDAAALAPDATIVLQGGGNFGDLYDLHQRFRERIIGQCRDNRIVLLPQTIHFESPQRLDECMRVFASHPDLHVCLRDYTSYNFFRRHFPNPVYLYPDMAHFLWDEFANHRRMAPRQATLLFLRVDKEKCPLTDKSTAGQTPMDWRDMINPLDRAAFGVLHRLHRHHGGILPRTDIHPLWRLFREHLTVKAARLLSDYDAVVTNRLHMAILGLLMGRKVAMADNSYGKLSAYHGCWLSDMPAVQMLSAQASEAPPRALVPAAI